MSGIAAFARTFVLVVTAALTAAVFFTPAAAADDTTPPETFITEGPISGANSPVFFKASSDDPTAQFECRVLGLGSPYPAWAPCPGGEARYSLPAWTFTFGVRAFDEAGNFDPTPAERTFDIFTLAIVPWTAPPVPTRPEAGPVMRIRGPQRIETRRKAVPVTFSLYLSKPVTLSCAIDKGPSEPCGSPASETFSITTRRLRVGIHDLRVTATDVKGNEAVVKRSFRIVRRP